MSLQDKSLICVDSICELLIGLLRNITLYDEFAEFPHLTSHIMTSLIDGIISKVKDKTKQQINELLKNENDYIWTDSDKFINDLSQITKTGSFDIDPMIKFLDGYFDAIKNIVAHSVPKIIMSNIVREIENTMLSFLLQFIVIEEKLSLLKHDDEMEKQRIYYNDLRQRVLTIKKGFIKNN